MPRTEPPRAFWSALFMLFSLITLAIPSGGYGWQPQRAGAPRSKPAGGVVDNKPAAQPADETPVEKVAEQPALKGPIGQFVSIDSPVDDAVYGKVTTAALALQARAQREGREGILVLEIAPGRSSHFHHVQGLAKFLSEQVPNLQTVAWIPQPIPGSHTVLALACREIVIREDAALGEINLRPEELAERTFVLNLADKRMNRKVSPALVAGMLDVKQKLIWYRTGKGQSSVVTADQFEKIEKEGQAILNNKVLKEADVPGLFTGEQARMFDILATHVLPKDAERLDVARKYQLPTEAMREQQPEGKKQKATIIRIDEPVSPVVQQFVKRQIDRAVSDGITLVIFEIDFPQSDLNYCMNLADSIMEMSQRNVHTVAFASKQALGGAAIIALACDDLYLTRQAELGQIQVAQQLNGDQNKLRDAVRLKLAEIGTKKGRPPALLQAMADESLVVYQAVNRQSGEVNFLSAEELQEKQAEWMKGEALPETTNKTLLTVDGRKANRLRLALAPVDDLNELKSRLGLDSSAEIPVAQPTWVDWLVFELNRQEITTALFLLGLMFAYMELHFNVGLFGIGSGVCFTLFFWSRFLGGTADFLELALFVLGVACLAVELFVLPGFGVFGISGILLVLFSLILASQTFIIPASKSELVVFARNFGTLLGSLTAMVVLAAFISRLLPKMPFFEHLVLTPPGDVPTSGPRLKPTVFEPDFSGGTLLARDHSLIGQIGISMTSLRPAGKARIGDAQVDVISEGTFIPAGRAVEVTSVEGTIVVVRESIA